MMMKTIPINRVLVNLTLLFNNDSKIIIKIKFQKFKKNVINRACRNQKERRRSILGNQIIIILELCKIKLQHQ